MPYRRNIGGRNPFNKALQCDNFRPPNRIHASVQMVNQRLALYAFIHSFLLSVVREAASSQ